MKFSHKGYVCEITSVSFHFTATICVSDTEQGKTFLDFAKSRVSEVMANYFLEELKAEFINLVERFTRVFGEDFPLYPKPELPYTKLRILPFYTRIPVGNKPRQSRKFQMKQAA
jgi:hypothetical protein